MNESKAYYDRSCGAAIGYFYGYFDFEKFKKIAEELHVIRKNNKSYKQLNNIENMKVLKPEIQQWLNDQWFPKAKALGLKYFAFVVPKDLFGKVSMENANKDTTTNGIDIQYFRTEVEAKAWLQTK